MYALISSVAMLLILKLVVEQDKTNKDKKIGIILPVRIYFPKFFY